MPKTTSNDIIDFGAIEEGGGGGVRVPEGDYKAKVKKVEFTHSQAGNPMFKWTFVGTEGRLKGKELFDYTALTLKALFKLRDLLTAISGKAPTGKVDVRALTTLAKKQVGKELGVTLGDEEYTNDKGKTVISSKIQDYLPLDSLSGKAPEDDIEDEDDEGVEEEGLEGLSRAELKAYIKEHELDIAVKKSMTDDDLRAAIAELTEDEEDEDDEDDEDDEEESEDDPLEGLDRAELKAYIKSNKLDVTVKKSMSDDDIADAIRAASGDEDDEEEIEDIDIDEL